MARNIEVRPRENNIEVLQERIDLVSKIGREINKKNLQNDRHRKYISECRQKLMKDIYSEMLVQEMHSKSIFISYSATGKSLGEIAKSVAEDYGFIVKTGFDNDVEYPAVGPNSSLQSLPHSIMSSICACDCFLGIWTEDFDAASRKAVGVKGNSIEGSSGTIPSVWMPFELGVATSHNKPFRLIVIRGTHVDYYTKPFYFYSNIIFERHEFPNKIKEVVDWLNRNVEQQKRHSELLL